MSKGNNNNLKLKIMRTKELLSKSVITRDEKIAHLKKLGLWREYLKEVNAWDEQCLSTSSSLELLLNSNVSWKTFLYASFSFARAVKRHDFWSHVANYGKRPDRLKRKSISVYDFDFTLAGHGRYKVTYTSESEESYTAVITDMTVIDATKNSDSPKVKDLKALKTLCITNNYL